MARCVDMLGDTTGDMEDMCVEDACLAVCTFFLTHLPDLTLRTCPGLHALGLQTPVLELHFFFIIPLGSHNFFLCACKIMDMLKLALVLLFLLFIMSREDAEYAESYYDYEALEPATTKIHGRKNKGAKGTKGARATGIHSTRVGWGGATVPPGWLNTKKPRPHSWAGLTRNAGGKGKGKGGGHEEDDD